MMYEHSSDHLFELTQDDKIEFIKRWERNFTYVGFDCIRQRKRENLTEFRARVRILLDTRKVKT